MYGNFKGILSAGSRFCKREVDFLFSDKYPPTLRYTSTLRTSSAEKAPRSSFPSTCCNCMLRRNLEGLSINGEMVMLLHQPPPQSNSGPWWSFSAIKFTGNKPPTSRGLFPVPLPTASQQCGRDVGPQWEMDPPPTRAWGDIVPLGHLLGFCWFGANTQLDFY